MNTDMLKGLACTGGVCRIHRSVRKDPFGVLTGAFVGRPKPIAVHCQACREPICRAYTPSELTGRNLSYYSSSCTMLSQLAQLPDPTLEDWSQSTRASQSSSARCGRPCKPW
jgi:hypothetical protein